MSGGSSIRRQQPRESPVTTGPALVGDRPGAIALSVLIPVRNETLNLRVMIRILNAALDDSHEIIVIYDDPEDASIEVIRQSQSEFDNVVQVFNEDGHGVANAIRAGVRAARGNRVLIFAADEIGPVLAVDDMMILMDEGCDFVSCTRYAHGGRRLGGSVIGHILSWAANKLLNAVSRISMTDSTTGIKMFRREDFPRLVHSTNSVGWSVAFEMAVNAQILGLRIGEVPIISIDRLFGGKSTFRLVPWVIGYSRIFMLALRRVPARPFRPRPSSRVRIPLNCIEH
jgi:dolichol-phosphate mannosyltransferase